MRPSKPDGALRRDEYGTHSEMKITFVMPKVNMAGGIRVVAMHAEYLQRRGHDVFVISTGPRRPSWKERCRSWVKGTPPPTGTRPTHSHFDDLAISHRALSRWRPITDADVPDADVVVATWWETAEWVAALSPSKGAKAYFLQGYEVDVLGNDEEIARLKATWSLPLRKIVVAQWLQQIARDEYGDNDVACVPNGVDAQRFFAPSRDKQQAPTVGFVFSTAPIKGSDIALRAYHRARQTIPELKLVAFGAQHPTESLALPESASFTYRPPQDRLKDFYASCDAWLFASRREGFGLPVLEAMACRTPVIATPAGCAQDMLRDGGGILVEPENAEQMTEAILRVCRMSGATWRDLSQRAYATACKHTWEHAGQLFEAALMALVERVNDSQPRPPVHGSQAI